MGAQESQVILLDDLERKRSQVYDEKKQQEALDTVVDHLLTTLDGFLQKLDLDLLAYMKHGQRICIGAEPVILKLPPHPSQLLKHLMKTMPIQDATINFHEVIHSSTLTLITRGFCVTRKVVVSCLPLWSE